MNEQERIGKSIARARKLRNMKQVELGAAIGVTDQTVSNWEVGLRSPRADYLRRMCRVLNCSADFLLGISDEVGQSPRQNQLDDGADRQIQGGD